MWEELSDLGTGLVALKEKFMPHAQSAPLEDVFGRIAYGVYS
jgi:hypothetical protein